MIVDGPKRPRQERTPLSPLLSNVLLTDLDRDSVLRRDTSGLDFLRRDAKRNSFSADSVLPRSPGIAGELCRRLSVRNLLGPRRCVFRSIGLPPGARTAAVADGEDSGVQVPSRRRFPRRCGLSPRSRSGGRATRCASTCRGQPPVPGAPDLLLVRQPGQTLGDGLDHLAANVRSLGRNKPRWCTHRDGKHRSARSRVSPDPCETAGERVRLAAWLSSDGVLVRVETTRSTYKEDGSVADGMQLDEKSGVAPTRYADPTAEGRSAVAGLAITCDDPVDNRLETARIAEDFYGGRLDLSVRGVPSAPRWADQCIGTTTARKSNR